jgi:hypothetical protein
VAELCGGSGRTSFSIPLIAEVRNPPSPQARPKTKTESETCIHLHRAIRQYNTLRCKSHGVVVYVAPDTLWHTPSTVSPSIH